MPPIPHALPDYAELHCISNFSFQRGASHPEELVIRACELGYTALAITDECSVAGVVRAHVGLRDYWAENGKGAPCPLRLLFGSEFVLPGMRLVALAHDLAGWGGLCQFITNARTTAPKGSYQVDWDTSDFTLLQGCEILCVPERHMGGVELSAIQPRLHTLAALFPGQLWLVVELLQALDDDLWLASLQQLGATTGVPLVAAGDVHMHSRRRKPLQDVITAVRHGRPVADCGFALQPNAERHLRPRMRLAQLYPATLLAHTLEVAARCRFDLDDIRRHYQYPMENLPPGLTPTQALAQLTWAGAQERYPQGVPSEVHAQVEHELALIAELGYEMFFITVEDIVGFARRKGILCQGRGSSANSAVCFCLGITAIDPTQGHLLFERFISRERREPPDIDVDFEHQRREEVIQYIYGKYGRDRAAIAAVVICYRTRSALRDVGKALGIHEALVDAFASDHHWFDSSLLGERLEAAQARSGVSEDPLRVRQWLQLSEALQGFPRHLSQHVGGFVLTQTPLCRLVPIENAAMPDRSIIQWEKDDLEAMGMLKVDVLALGMLSAIQRGLNLLNQWRGTALEMHHLQPTDPAVYDMVCTADTVGVFQIESRAQMSMLPRLRPRRYYDLVVEVAIVRPGPIQGGMVHPYLQRRHNLALVNYPKGLHDALERTLGVPIFQEQVMQIAMIAANFSADEADRLRRAMAAWKRKGGLEPFEERLVEGMVDNGYERGFSEAIFRQMQGFGEYGFPESHAASFAVLVYVSCWLKCYEPACFLAALLDSQPMGFYSPSQLVQDARRHGVQVLPVDVMVSGLDSVLEHPHGGHQADSAVWPGTTVAQPLRLPQPAVRLGLRRIAGLSEAGAKRLLAAREQAPFTSTENLALRAALDPRDMGALASADALQVLSGHRRQQVWDATAQRRAPALLRHAPVHEVPLHLPAASEGEEIVGDYRATGLTLRRHPLALLRPRLDRLRVLTASTLRPLPNNTLVRACGIVTVRQRPPTAKGTMFVTLEDETGTVNIIVWPDVVEAWRGPLLQSRLLAVQGVWQRDGGHGEVRHLLARKFRDLTPWLGVLGEHAGRSRNFH